MLHGLKHRIHSHFDHVISVVNEVLNNPKTAPVVGAYSVSVGFAEINNVLNMVSITVGLIVGGMSLWIMIEKRIREGKERKQSKAEKAKRDKALKKKEMEEAAIRKLKMEKLALEKNSLENHIRKQSK